MVMYLVYKVTNVQNDKIYIGITGHSFEHRWKQHLSDTAAKRNDFVFHKALAKYGVDSFITEVVFTDLTKEEAREKERELIKQYDSFYLNGHGYNMTYGGECNDHLRGGNAPVALFTDEQADLIKKQLKNTEMSFEEILTFIGFKNPSSTSALRSVSAINEGKNYRTDNYTYPVRQNPRAVMGKNRTCDKNPGAKLTNEQALNLISDLANTHLSQAELAQKYNISQNAVNVINRCKTWKELHTFKRNIRRESQGEHPYVAIKLSRRYTDQQVLEAIYLLKNTKIPVTEIAKQLKMKTGVVHSINYGKTRRDMHSYPIPIRNKKGA